MACQADGKLLLVVVQLKLKYDNKQKNGDITFTFNVHG